MGMLLLPMLMLLLLPLLLIVDTLSRTLLLLLMTMMMMTMMLMLMLMLMLSIYLTPLTHSGSAPSQQILLNYLEGQIESNRSAALSIEVKQARKKLSDTLAWRAFGPSGGGNVDDPYSDEDEPPESETDYGQDLELHMADPYAGQVTSAMVHHRLSKHHRGSIDGPPRLWPQSPRIVVK